MSVPDEITMLRSQLDAAIAATDAAETARDAAADAYHQAGERLAERENSLRQAVADEDAAYADYKAALHAHGFAQTATGPKPKEITDALKHATGGDFGLPEPVDVPCALPAGCGHPAYVHDRQGDVWSNACQMCVCTGYVRSPAGAHRRS